MARAKGFADWNPQRKTRGLLADIDVVLDEYRAYLPLTIRQVFYRQAVEDALDLNVLRASREREKQERDEVGKKLDDVNRYLREAFGLEDEDDDDHVDDDDDDEDQE
jgi:hypothetical protein